MGRRLFEDTKEALKVAQTPVLAEQPQFSAPVSVSPVSTSVSQPTRSALQRVPTSEDIDRLGEGRSDQNSGVVNKMMAVTKISTVDEVGESLNQAIALAKGLDPESMGKLGWLGRLTGIGKSVKETFQARYDTLEGRLDTLAEAQVKHIQLHEQRVSDIEQLYEDNRELCNAYEADQVNAQGMLAALKAHLASLETSTDVFAAQDKHRVQSAITRVEKFMYDTQSLIQKSHQRAPRLDDMADNARQLVAAMKHISERLIPDLKETYTDFILGLEQKKTAEVANGLYDMHDQVTRKGAELHRKNVEEIATLTERPLVKAETLRYTQTLYLQGAQKALEIHEAGQKARIEGLKQLKALDDELIAHASKAN
jgi:uncharacterized protein YaaN involved in tellurite resistance